MFNCSSELKNKLKVERTTAVWAFSEGAFGGLLHLFKIPFKGLFLSGIAVNLISLIDCLSKNKREIIRSTTIVEIIKAAISPHSPLSAYIGVAVDGFSGYLFYKFIPSKRIASLLFALTTMFYSAFQRIFTLTIIFGMALWESIDSFSNYVISSVFHLHSLSFSLSQILISFYVLIHLASGIYFGNLAFNIGTMVNEFHKDLPPELKEGTFEMNEKKKKRIKMRPSGVLIIAFLIFLLIFSYINPSWQGKMAITIIMILRAFLITFLWYVFISPIVKKMIYKLVSKKEHEYIEEINSILSSFPHFKAIVNYSWKANSKLKGFKRLNQFIKSVLVLSLTYG